MTGPLQRPGYPRVFAGLLILAVPVLIFGFWLHGAWKAGNETISEELARFDRLRSIAAYKQVLETVDAGVDETVYSDLFLKEGTVAVISADLLTRLKQLAATQNIEVMRAGDLSPKAEGAITLVGGSVEMSGTIPGIYALVQQIETAKPLLFIDRLVVRSNGSGSAGDKTDTRLMVQINVYGAIRTSNLSTDGKDG